MKKYFTRPVIVALTFVVLAMPFGTAAFASTPTTTVTGTDPEPQGNVTGTDPEPQGGIVKTILTILHLS